VKFPDYRQLDTSDCGATCLRMIAKYYGKHYNLDTLKEKCAQRNQGVSMLSISKAAEDIGMKTIGVRMDFEQLLKERPLPMIAHWNQEHFVVVIKATRKHVSIADPGSGIHQLDKETFLQRWISTRKDSLDKGAALLLQPTVNFYIAEEEKKRKLGWRFLLSYLKPHRKFMLQLAMGLLFGTLMQLILPFLTQAVVDIGIESKDIHFIYLILLSQFVFLLSRSSIDFIRSWILLHVSTRINLSLLVDFLIKLMKLPIGYFDTKRMGDILQRMGDHSRIENVLTNESLNILFSIVNFFIFSIVLAIYNIYILFIFIIGSTLYVLWIYLFMKRRRTLDYKNFTQGAENHNKTIQLIQGIQEIKLQNAERQKRWEWERVQATVFKLNIKGLALNQYQQAGSLFINGITNILISAMSATAVVKGSMTMGMMMSVSYIIGQLNSPINQLIGFIHSLQDAKISIERLGEIHFQENEVHYPDTMDIKEMPDDETIEIKSVTFKYNKTSSESALQDVTFKIPKNKITAIVGESGSGKTTLMKLLLGFYEPTEGEILLGGNQLSAYNPEWWRGCCGAVMQDGFIFSDTIANNIAVGHEHIDKEKLINACKVANIMDFIQSRPLGFNTKIGSDGQGISQGQKQRILIARAVYKNPVYLFFDEATNALDANNELQIMKKMNLFFEGKTVLIIAHRLSTVKNADNIIVLEKGNVIESGTHVELSAKRGVYYHLVKNQLELGK
jgi:ATP-binding cassette subfamily B protein